MLLLLSAMGKQTGLGYGASFSVPGGVLVVGGEDSEAKARNEVFLLRWDGRALSIEN
jgi:N-acetylneuraminate epimerase